MPDQTYSRRTILLLTVICASIVAGCEPQYDVGLADTSSNRAGLKRHLGFAPPDAVTDVYYYADALGADATYQLTFRLDQSTLEKIVEGLELTQREPEILPDGREFEWWDAEEIKHFPLHWKKDEQKELYCYLWHDAKSGRAFYLEFTL